MNVLDDEGMTTTKVIEVTADVCDTCGARAFFYAMVNGTELAYCGHHGSVYLPKLAQISTVIIDLRHTIGHS